MTKTTTKDLMFSYKISIERMERGLENTEKRIAFLNTQPKTLANLERIAQYRAQAVYLNKSLLRMTTTLAQLAMAKMLGGGR